MLRFLKRLLVLIIAYFVLLFAIGSLVAGTGNESSPYFGVLAFLATPAVFVLAPVLLAGLLATRPRLPARFLPRLLVLIVLYLAVLVLGVIFVSTTNVGFDVLAFLLRPSVLILTAVAIVVLAAALPLTRRN